MLYEWGSKSDISVTNLHILGKIWAVLCANMASLHTIGSCHYCHKYILTSRLLIGHCKSLTWRGHLSVHSDLSSHLQDPSVRFIALYLGSMHIGHKKVFLDVRFLARKCCFKNALLTSILSAFHRQRFWSFFLITSSLYSALQCKKCMLFVVRTALKCV